MRRATWAAIAERANASLGLASRQDLADLGVRAKVVDAAVVSGLLRSAGRGVWAVAAAPPPPEQPIEAARLALGRDAVVFHQTAAWLHGFEQVLPDPVHLSVHRGTHNARRRVAAAHITTVMDPDHVVTVRGVRCTSAARTTCDLVSEVHWTQVARFLDHGLTTDPLLVAKVEACVARLFGPGHACFDDLRMLCDERGPGAGNIGPLAVRIVADLVARGVRRPDAVEFEVVVDGVPRRIDDVWLPEKVGLEVKGWSAHRGRVQFDVDADREGALAAHGWVIVPATSRTNLDKLAGRLRRLLFVRTSTPETGVEVRSYT
jgi:hypothetical protein